MLKSSKRVVMLVDCQSFYASVEKAEHPEYKDRPLVVAGIRNVVQELCWRLALLPSQRGLLPQSALGRQWQNARILLLLSRGCNDTSMCLC